jgi:hypothetical protein
MVLFVIGWMSIIAYWKGELPTVLGVSVIPSGAFIHGTWLGLLTVLFLLERKTTEGR